MQEDGIMSDQLWVGPSRSGAILRIDGYATGAVSVTAHAFIKQSLAVGTSWIGLDLSQAKGIDSTFIGGLILLRQRHGNQRFAIGRPSEAIAKTIDTMRLGSLIKAEDTLPAVSGAWVPVPLEMYDNARLGRHVLQCHLKLAEQEGPQGSSFRALVDRLRCELGDESEEQR